MAEKAETVNGVGNTDTTPFTKEKRPSNVSHYCFTHNNYTILDGLAEKDEIVSTKCIAINRMVELLDIICKAYIFQPEIGEGCGTIHLQGFIILKKPMRITELKTHFKNVIGGEGIHWEKRIGSVTSCIAYCSKQHTKDLDFPVPYCKEIVPPAPPATLNIISKLRPWQAKLEEICSPVPDDRTIHWIFDPDGNNGKTSFCKYMYVKYNAMLCTGGNIKDISCSIALLQKSGKDLNSKNIFIFNFPRCTEKISYKSIEAVKDGLIFSPKYESSCLVFNSPHLICFANNMPNTDQLSMDRWKFYRIQYSNLLDYSIDQYQSEFNII